MRFLALSLLLGLAALALAAEDPTKAIEINCNGVYYQAVLSCTDPQNAMGSSGTEFWADSEGTPGGSQCGWSEPIMVSVHNFDMPRPGYTPYSSNESIPLSAPLGVARSYGPPLAPTIRGFTCSCPGGDTEYILQVTEIVFTPPTFGEYGTVYLVWGGVEYVLARTTRAEGQASVQVVFPNGYFHVPAGQVTHNGQDSDPHLRSDGKIDVIGTQDCQENRTILGGIGKTGLGTGQIDYEYDHIPLGYAGTRTKSFPTSDPDHWPPSRYSKWIDFCKDYPDSLPNAAVIKGNARYAPDWQGTPSMPTRNVKVHVFELDSWNHPRYVAGQSLTVGATINPSDVKWATPASGASQQARLVVSDFANPNRKRIFDNPSISGGTVSANWDGKLYDGGNTSGTPYDLAGCDYKLELTCWFENYYWSPVGQGQAVLNNQQFDFREVGARLESVTFKGTGQYGTDGFVIVLPDPGDPETMGYPDYGQPHWSQTRVWEGYSPSPVAYKRQSQVAVTATFCTDGSAFRVRASGMGLNFAHPDGVYGSTSGNALTANLTSDSILSDKIDYFQESKITWEVSKDDGATWQVAGESKNEFYQLLNQPPTSFNAYHTLVHIGCVNAAGKTTEATAFTSIWEYFEQKKVVRVDGVPLKYWNIYGDFYMPEVFTAEELLSDENNTGRCEAWADLLIKTCEMQGFVDPGSFDAPYDPSSQNADLIFVGKWLYEEQGTSGDPDFPYRNTYYPQLFYSPSEYIWIDAEVNDRRDGGFDGQNTANPFKVFANHQWVKRGTLCYDPSYGSIYLDHENFEARILTGWGGWARKVGPMGSLYGFDVRWFPMN